MRHKFLIARQGRRIINAAISDSYAGGGHKGESHPSTQKAPESDSRFGRVFTRRRLKKARKRTKGIVNDAIRKGQTFVQVEVYGDIDSKVYQELGWEPMTETWNRDIGGYCHTLRMRVPKVPWD